MGGATQHQAPPPALSLCFIISNSLQPPSFRVTLLSRPLAARIPLAAEETSSADLGWGGTPACPVLWGCHQLCRWCPSSSWPPRIKVLRPVCYLLKFPSLSFFLPKRN